MTTKQQVIERLESLPESASLADFKEELEIMVALKEGQQDIAEGKVSNVEEAKATLDSWFTK
jgi:predicted transcriptional regulator